MRNPIIVPILLTLFLQGCYQTSLAPMIGPAATASQGNLAYSAATTGFSYGVKHKTGKFPYEHIIHREKEKIVQRIDKIEKKVIENSTLIKDKFIQHKMNAKNGENDITGFRWVLHLKEIKNGKQEEAFPANKPRYSYWSKQK